MEAYRESSSVVCGYRHTKAIVKFIKHCTFTSYLKSLDSKICLAKNRDMTDGKCLVPELLLSFEKCILSPINVHHYL